MAYLQELALQIAAHTLFEPAIIWLLGVITNRVLDLLTFSFGFN